jgi:uncharacterized OsmC-like protein
MAAAVGACAHYFAAAILQARKLPLTGLSVMVEAEKTKEPSPRFGKLALRLTLPAATPEHLLPQIQRAVRNCPAYGTLLHPPEVELTFVTAAAVTPATAE